MQIRNVYGIDLGTSTVKIYDLKKDTITKEKKCKQKKADALLLLIFLCGKFQRIFLFTAKTAHLRASRLNPFCQLSSLIYYNPLAQEKTSRCPCFPREKRRTFYSFGNPSVIILEPCPRFQAKSPGAPQKKTAAPPVLCTGGTVPALGLKEISHSRSRSRVRRTA